jgi:septal ring factor EnvC (AmiA/AmiB activator)
MIGDKDMKTLILTLYASLVLLTSQSAMADERPDHFEGRASDTLEQALANLAEANREVAEILAQEEIAMADMARIHQLTYTLENALERIDEDYDQLEEQLEALHLASEGADPERARELGETYLNNAERFPRS